MCWVFRVREGGGEFGGAGLQGCVDGLALVLLDEGGGGVDIGFGSVTVHLEGLEPSLLTRCAQ